jgi:hypothetical protein
MISGTFGITGERIFCEREGIFSNKKTPEIYKW